MTLPSRSPIQSGLDSSSASDTRQGTLSLSFFHLATAILEGTGELTVGSELTAHSHTFPTPKSLTAEHGHYFAAWGQFHWPLKPSTRFLPSTRLYPLECSSRGFPRVPQTLSTSTPSHLKLQHNPQKLAKLIRSSREELLFAEHNCR